MAVVRWCCHVVYYKAAPPSPVGGQGHACLSAYAVAQSPPARALPRSSSSSVFRPILFQVISDSCPVCRRPPFMVDRANFPHRTPRVWQVAGLAETDRQSTKEKKNSGSQRNRGHHLSRAEARAGFSLPLAN